MATLVQTQSFVLPATSGRECTSTVAVDSGAKDRSTDKAGNESEAQACELVARIAAGDRTACERRK